MDPDFDEFLHVPARLSIMALLAPADWVEFGFMREAIGASDSALSKQISALAEAGYVSVRKRRDRVGRHTLVRLTPQGRQALRRHALALQRIVEAAQTPGRPDDQGEAAPRTGPAPAVDHLDRGEGRGLL